MRRLQCDEIWCFIGAKAKNTRIEKKAELGWGDIWTWFGIDADTKLVVSYMVGNRDGGSPRLLGQGEQRVASLVARLALDGEIYQERESLRAPQQRSNTSVARVDEIDRPQRPKFNHD